MTKLVRIQSRFYLLLATRIPTKYFSTAYQKSGLIGFFLPQIYSTSKSRSLHIFSSTVLYNFPKLKPKLAISSYNIRDIVIVSTLSGVSQYFSIDESLVREAKDLKGSQDILVLDSELGQCLKFLQCFQDRYRPLYIGGNVSRALYFRTSRKTVSQPSIALLTS